MITASQVKELREMTGAGMMDCKKALTECDGDLSKAVDWLREKGIAKAAMLAGRIASEGLTKIVVEGNKACVVEINSETDFVAKNEQFIALLNDVATAILRAEPADLEAALKVEVEGKSVDQMVTDATATIGEKITLRRFAIVSKEDADAFGAYMHMGGKISAVVVLKDCADAQLAKNIAMQVASMNPSYVSRNDMPQDVIEHERNIQTEIVKNDESLANKPEKVLNGIIEGRVSKTLQEMCLVDQIYFLESDKKVGKYLQENKTSCVTFVRYAVGEGIEKREDNFAEEVANAIK